MHVSRTFILVCRSTDQFLTVKYTTSGSITVCCTTFGEPEGLRSTNQTAVEIIVADTGCGIAPEKLESIFREFEQVESSEPKTSSDAGVGAFFSPQFHKV